MSKAKIAVGGIDTRGCTFIVVPHNHAQAPFMAPVVSRSGKYARQSHRCIVEVDTSHVSGRYSLVMLDASGQRHLLGHGDAFDQAG